jgi:hypothetical protein
MDVLHDCVGEERERSLILFDKLPRLKRDRRVLKLFPDHWSKKVSNFLWCDWRLSNSGLRSFIKCVRTCEDRIAQIPSRTPEKEHHC